MFEKRGKNMFHKELITIGSNDIGPNFELRLSSFFKIMQDVIMHDSDERNIGYSVLTKKNLLWVVTRIQLEINRMPKYEEDVVAITYPGKNMKVFYPRHFRLETKDGEPLIRFSSIWVLLDATTRKPILQDVFERLPEYSLPDELPLPPKVELVEGELIEKRKIHYSDVDLNNHLNNTRYIEILSDVHDSEFLNQHRIQSVTINYLKEIKEGSFVDVFATKGNPEHVQIKSDDQLAFAATITYK